MDEQEKTLKFKRIDQLKFDPNNPRLPSKIDGSDETAVLEWMLNDATLIELMGSIAEQNYFPGEPLLVTPDPDVDNTFIVVEGNRRLAAVKLLNDPGLASAKQKAVQLISDEAKYTPDRLPVLEYPSAEDILRYLGYRHVTGIKEWGPLEKAKYLEMLLETVEEPEPLEQYRYLAKIIGSRSDYVARLLTTLAIQKKIVEENYFGLYGLDAETIEFSVLLTALSYANIYRYVGLESNRDRSLTGLREDKLERLTAWVFEKTSTGKPRVRESRQLKELNKVVDSPRALAAFDQKGYSLDEAVILTGEPDKIFRESINRARMNLETARDQSHNTEGLTKADSENLFEIAKLARSLRAVVDNLILEQELSEPVQ